MKTRFWKRLIIPLIILIPAALYFLLTPRCFGCRFDDSLNQPGYLKDGGLHVCHNNFPDKAFRKFVAENYGTGEGSVIPLDTLAQITVMDCSGIGCEDLEGIQHFSGLKELNCSNNQLTELFVYEHTPYERLTVSKFPDLEILDCSHNQITRLDLQAAYKLHTIRCSNNVMSYLTVPHHDLVYVDCSYNRLHFSWLINDFEQRTLTYLNCSYNLFSDVHFDRSNTPNLSTFLFSPQYKGTPSCSHKYQNGFLFFPGHCIYCSKTEPQSIEDKICMVALPVSLILISFAVFYVIRRNKWGKDWETASDNLTREDQQPYIN